MVPNREKSKYAGLAQENGFAHNLLFPHNTNKTIDSDILLMRLVFPKNWNQRLLPKSNGHTTLNNS
jgi:hypothetical protein